MMDTRRPDPPQLEGGERQDGGGTYNLAGRSVILLRLMRE
jgi:hypothetical protein